jgi:hypothetical protein
MGLSSKCRRNILGHPDGHIHSNLGAVHLQPMKCAKFWRRECFARTEDRENFMKYPMRLEQLLLRVWRELIQQYLNMR